MSECQDCFNQHNDQKENKMKCINCDKEGDYCLYDENDKEVYYCLEHYKLKCSQLGISDELD